MTVSWQIAHQSHHIKKGLVTRTVSPNHQVFLWRELSVSYYPDQEDLTANACDSDKSLDFLRYVF